MISTTINCILCILIFVGWWRCDGFQRRTRKVETALSIYPSQSTHISLHVGEEGELNYNYSGSVLSLPFPNSSSLCHLSNTMIMHALALASLALCLAIEISISHSQYFEIKLSLLLYSLLRMSIVECICWEEHNANSYLN